MNEFEHDVKDMVNRYYGDYQYDAQLANFQAQIAVQHQAWLNAADKIASSYGDMDPKLDLYRFLDECGAIACPIGVYDMFASLYMFERSNEISDVKVRLRDRAKFADDKWLLLTKSSDYRMELHGQASYALNILVGFGVEIDQRNLPILGGQYWQQDSEPNVLPRVRRLGNVCQMRPCKPSFSDQPEYYATMNADDGGLNLYMANI